MCKVFVLASEVRLEKKILEKASHRLQLYFSFYTVVHVHIHWDFRNGVSHKGKMYACDDGNEKKKIKKKPNQTKRNQAKAKPIRIVGLYSEQSGSWEKERK